MSTEPQREVDLSPFSDTSWFGEFWDPRVQRRLIVEVPSDTDWRDFRPRSRWHPAQALWLIRNRLLRLAGY